MNSNPTNTDAAPLPLARRMWRTLEPYHGFVYFAAAATDCYTALGAPEPAHYFGSRAAPMGAVPAAVVQATFFNFAPRRVQAGIPLAWTVASPADWCAARLEGVDRTLRATIADAIDSPEMAHAARLARTAADVVAGLASGRPLGAAHAALPWPIEPHLALWQAVAVLREFRGDGHIALLTGAGLSGIEALVLHAAMGDIPATLLQSTRGWTDTEWSAAIAGLVERDLVDAAGQFTATGHTLRVDIEAGTDALAAAPWDTLGEDRGAELRQLVRPWSKAIVDAGAVGFARPSRATSSADGSP
jgi:hypothetical protein